MRPSSLVRICLLLAVGAAPVALIAQTPTFAAPKQFPPSTPHGDASGVVLAGNFNGNGNTDFIAGVGNPSTGAVSLEFISGDGNGNFTQTGTVNASLFNTGSFTVGDVNGDGKDDIIELTPGCEESPCENWPNNEGDRDGVFTVWLGQGNGQFTQGFIDNLPEGDDVVEGLVADFNKDGKNDVAVLATSGMGGLDYSSIPYLCIFLNNGNGTFTQTDFSLPLPLQFDPAPTNLVVGDFEGNGNLDLAFAYESGTGVPTGHPELLTFANDGKGNFGPAVISYTFNDNGISYVTSGPSLFASDLNGDGRTDLVISIGPNFGSTTGAPSVVTLLTDSQGKFHWGSSVSVARAVQNLLLSDVNGDGHPDLVFVGNGINSSGQSYEDAGVYLGTATGAFKTPHVSLSVPGTGNQLYTIAAPFKSGALPNLFVTGAKSVALMFVNTTK